MRQVLHGGVRRYITGQINEGIVVYSDVPPVPNWQQYDPQSQSEQAHGPEQTSSLLSDHLWRIGQLVVQRLWVIRTRRQMLIAIADRSLFSGSTAKRLYLEERGTFWARHTLNHVARAPIWSLDQVSPRAPYQQLHQQIRRLPTTFGR